MLTGTELTEHPPSSHNISSAATTTTRMDLNPTFGHQEFLESLSQKSASSTKSSNTANTNSKQMNEAVRRLGYRLSVQAHGGDIRGGAAASWMSPQPPLHIPKTLDHAGRQSGFVPFLEHSIITTGGSVDETETEMDHNNANNNNNTRRTTKVAKTYYSDHGEHSGGVPKMRLTRKLTLNCKECFRKWEAIQRHSTSSYTGTPSTSAAVELPPTHRFSLEHLALGSTNNNNSQPSSAAAAAATMRDSMSRHKTAAAVTNHRIFPSHHEPLPPSLEEGGYEDDEDDANVDDDYNKQQQLIGDLMLPSSHPHTSSQNNNAAAAAKRRMARLAGHTGVGSPGTARSNKSLLSAVMEAESNTTVTSNSDQQQKQQRQQQHSQLQQLYKQGDDSAASQSISTKDSKTGSYGMPPQPPSSNYKRQPQQQESDPRPARGKCLTTPSEPVGNDGLDNEEGNLIVYENDSIIVARRNMRTIQRSRQQQKHLYSSSNNNSSNEPTAEFRVQGLQGQGTFAQVFQCLHVQTGKLVAVKIIKNKAVYTRQAAIEIDIFQTLQQEETTRQSMPASSAAASSTSSARQQQNQQSNESSTQTKSSNLDYMVNLDFYFMHQNHLCLVFELLGWNLYEVLRRRQYQGLPIFMVRAIVKQVIEGCRDLSQKNVVHCDLKPENILLLSEEANLAVVMAGDAQSRVSDRSCSLGGAGGGSSQESGRDGTTMSSGGPKPQPSTSTNSHASTTPTCNTERPDSKVKIIDFGSACFEGYTAHTYIQSRFYRSPEVLMGLPYDSAIDMWSLGCVAAELFLGLPILPGVHEHDQLVRIAEMIANIPEWMIDQGSKSTKYYVKYVPRPNSTNSGAGSNNNNNDPSMRSDISVPSSGGGSLPLPQWRLKTQQEYISSLSEASIRKKGGIEKLSKQPGTRYFKEKRLSDILKLQANQCHMEERELVLAFVHFLYGILDPDPWKRWTAFQAAQHPFVTGNLGELRPKGSNIVMDPKEENQANLECDIYWPSPWDPAICRRKLNKQKMREKQHSMRRTVSNRSHHQQRMSRAGRGGGGLSVGPMFTGGQQQQHREPSPPMQISPSISTSGSHAGVTVSAGESSGFLAPVGWQGHAGQSQLAFGNGPQIIDTQSATISAANRQQYSGAQGLQGGTGYTPSNADFAQALVRPGVIPGSYGMGTSVASQSTAASFQFGNNSQNFLYGGGNMFLQDGTPSGMLSMQGGGPLFEQYLSGVPGQVPHEEPFRGMSSAASSVTMTEAASHAGDPKQIDFLAQQQKQQLAFLQQQQMMQQSYQQQQQFALQQPMLASGPGGFYYVTTSSTGQPILLQPVGLLNQQGVGGPMFMNGQPGANQQLQNLNQEMFAQPQVLHNQHQVHNGAPIFGGIPQYSTNPGTSQEQPQQYQMYQPQQQPQHYMQQEQQQQPHQQRYLAPPAPRDQYRHGRGGGTSY